MTRTRSFVHAKLLPGRRIALVAASIACLVAAPLAWPRTTAIHHNGNIAYVAGPDIGVITPSGAPMGTVRSCRGCNDAGELAWSSDGRKLAFVRGVVHGGVPKPWKFALFVSGAYGGHLHRLLRCGDCGAAQGSTISWSPKGSAIVLPHDGRLALVNVKTGSHRLVGGCVSHTAWSPAWSPDGSKIAYACGASLCVVNRRGGRGREIANADGQLSHLSWSPDGKALAFDAGDSIGTVRASGSNLQTLLSGQAGSGPGFPAWSPDGTRILYANTPGTPNPFFEVWVMNADGSHQYRLYRSSQPIGDYAAPIWSPNGKQIAFSVLTKTESGLLIMKADGSALHRIAPDAEMLGWQPRP
jgi:dipeptidyl aminopeptidase/acylaminoacyl peptidase